MPKPDKVLRSRPLKEVKAAILKLKRVVLFHPEPIVVERTAKMCICKKGERKRGRKSTRMTQCDECYEWFHNDCAGIPDELDVNAVEWHCEWCQDEPDREGYQRWKTGRKRPKKRHLRDRPREKGVELGGDVPRQYSAPP